MEAVVTPLIKSATLAASAVSVALLASACSSGRHVAVRGTPPPSSAVPASSAPAPSSASASVPSSSATAASSVAAPAPAASVPSAFQPASVTFVSPSNGFVVGVAPCSAGTCTTLVATTDAGHSWSEIGTPSPRLGGTAGVVSKLRFADSRDGWLFGPQLWATHDGGKTWHQISEPGQVTDVEASGGQAYALVGTRVLRTAVNTDSWQPVSGVTLTAPARSIALHGHAAWIVTGSGPGTSKLITSSDGATWRTLPDPCAGLGEEWALAGVAPVDVTHVYLLCGGGAAAGSEEKKVLFSSNGGLTATPTAVDPPRSGDVRDIAAASTNVVALSAQSGASWVYRSGDGGHSWPAVLQQGDGGFGYWDLGFTTSTQGVVIYGQPDMGAGMPTKLLMTRDAGASWAAVTF